MRYLLIREWEVHFSAKREMHEGTITKYVYEDTDDDYSEYEEGLVYSLDTGEEFDSDDKYASDGYHCIYEVESIEEITKKQYNEYKEIIEKYNSI